jgi:hypothetical protein
MSGLARSAKAVAVAKKELNAASDARNDLQGVCDDLKQRLTTLQSKNKKAADRYTYIYIYVHRCVCMYGLYMDIHEVQRIQVNPIAYTKHASSHL